MPARIAAMLHTVRVLLGFGRHLAETAKDRSASTDFNAIAVCLDLAVMPGFCTGQFWNTLFDSIRLHGGSVAVLMLEKVRREEAFSEEQDKKMGSNWDWQEMGREALRRVLGFFIGEAVDDSFNPLPQPSAMAAAVPPGPS